MFTKPINDWVAQNIDTSAGSTEYQGRVNFVDPRHFLIIRITTSSDVKTYEYYLGLAETDAGYTSAWNNRASLSYSSFINLDWAHLHGVGRIEKYQR